MGALLIPGGNDTLLMIGFPMAAWQAALAYICLSRRSQPSSPNLVRWQKLGRNVLGRALSFCPRQRQNVPRRAGVDDASSHGGFGARRTLVNVRNWRKVDINECP
jgi:hypothetical protein